MALPDHPRAGDQAVKPPISDELVERCAQAAFDLILAGRFSPVERYASRDPMRFADAPAATQDEWRVMARAVLTEALRPAPPPPVPDGQHPLI